MESKDNQSKEDKEKWAQEYNQRDIHLQAQCIIDQTKEKGYLYLSSLHVAHNAADLFYLDIDYVVTITHDQSLSQKVPIKDKNKKLHIAISDKIEKETIKTANETFSLSAEWIHHKLTKLKKNVLVHCSSGISRSPSLVIWYLMMLKDMNLKKAFRLVFDKRPIILPNDSLFAALQQKDIELNGSDCSSMNKAMYNAYSLFVMLRDLGVTIEDCEQALTTSKGLVNRAAQVLLTKTN